MDSIRQAKAGDEVTVRGVDGRIASIERYRSPALNWDLWQVDVAASDEPMVVVVADGSAYDGALTAPDADGETETPAMPEMNRGSAQFERTGRSGRKFGRCRYVHYSDGTSIAILMEHTGAHRLFQGRQLDAAVLEHYPA